MPAAAQQQWNPVNEDAESNDKRRLDEEYDARAWEELDVDWAKSALWGIWAVSYEEWRELAARARAEEMAENLEWENNSHSIQEIRTNIQERQVSTWEEENNEKTHQNTVVEIDNSEKRGENIQRAEELILSEENLYSQADNLPAHNPEEKKEQQDWIEANLSKWGTLETSFERIKGNFALPKNITGESMKEIYTQNPKNALIVNDALCDAINLEIHEHLLKWRVNYPRESVIKITKEIQDPETTPLEKMKLFGEIHTLVNTNVAKGGRKQKEAFLKRKKLWDTERQAEQAFQATKAEKALTDNIHDDSKQIDIHDIPDNTPDSGEVFSAGEIDVWSEWWEKPKQSV